MMVEPRLKIDELDKKLIEELKSDSRRSVRQLAKSLNESPSTIYNRVKRLESRSIIKKWTVSLDYTLLNLDTLSFIFIRLDNDPVDVRGIDAYQEISDRLKKIKGVYEIHFISGDYDILVKLRTTTVQEAGKIVMNQIRPIPGVARTVTNACFESILEETDVVNL